MSKAQINFRASDLTREQLDWLQLWWGTSQTETLTVAIDRVYQAERAGQDLPDAGPSRLSCATASGGRCDGQDLDAGGELPGQAEARAAAGDSWDVQTFLANKWRIDDTGAPLYALLSDAALAVVSLPSSRDRDAGAAHLAHELVALGRGAGLTLDDLRDLGERLQNELIAAIVQEAVASSPAAVAG